MADYPFLHNLSNGKSYYRPSLEEPADQEPVWSNREAQDFYESSHPISGLIAAGAAAGGLFASGFIKSPFDPNKRMWDYYVRGLRGIEEFSPGGVLRTFQLSSMASQFEALNARIPISADMISNNRILHDELARLIGPSGKGKPNTWNRLLEEGVELYGGKLYWAETGEIALPYAAAIKVPEGTGAHHGSAYARNLGVEAPDGKRWWKQHKAIPLSDFHGREFPFGQGEKFKHIVNPVYGAERMPIQITGGHTLQQHIGRQIAAWATEQVSRFNRLLQAPFEIQPFKSIFKGAQNLIHKFTGARPYLAVAESSGLKMMGNLAWKYGGTATAILLGYQTLDYMFKKSSWFDDTLFEEGLTYAAATTGVKANLMLSELAETTGLHAYREAQEELAPGSTNLSTLMAFPLVGALGAGFASYGALVAGMIKHPGDAATARREIVERMRAFSGDDLLSKLGKQLSDPKQLYARDDWIGKLLKKIATPKQFPVGSKKAGQFSTELSYKILGRLGPTKIAAGIGALAGAALIAPFVPGALVPSTRPDELERIYSGEQDVPVRRGRWWEFGRSPYEGQRVSYYRPHWYPRMRMAARDKAIYGEEMSPLKKWWKKEFTYELEEKHYESRPYPVTALPFQDVPLIGPLLAHTIGRIIKPPVYMHEEEWRQGDSVKTMPAGFGERRATEIGELPHGVPMDAHSPQALIGEQAYRLTEMIGLTGFAMTSIKQSLTGTPDLFDQQMMMESSRRMFGAEREYWDLEIGGGLGTTEALRRFLPHRRRQIPLYNPIRNTMPEWLPGPGEKSQDFQHGDPYTKVPEGELRLPGVGYEQRFPEVEGLSPEDYPDIHKYRILGDIAPYTDKFKQMRRSILSQRNRSDWSEYNEKIFQTTEEQTKQRKIRTEFEDYKYLTPMGDIFGDRQPGAETSSAAIAALNRAKAQNAPKEQPSLFEKIAGGYWEALSHNAETVIDQMTPAAPAAKLVHARTAIEDYERTQLYGTSNAFWNHPWRDFIRPALQTAAASIGFNATPEHIENKRQLEEYFDVLKYVKATRLSNIAREEDDTQAVREYEKQKDETLFGVNPYTRNFGSIFRALPRRERNYFNAFTEADTNEERSRILEMVPKNEKPLYIARWQLSQADELRQAVKDGVLSEQLAKEANQIVEETFDAAKSEGFPSDKELLAEYIATRNPGESYGDWYRRTKLLANYPLPGPDWVGWHPSVDLDDVKLKVVQNMGEDMHDYDLWESRVQGLVNKPFINNEMIEPIVNPSGNTTTTQNQINQLLSGAGIRSQISARRSYGKNTENDITLNVESSRDLKKLLGELG